MTILLGPETINLRLKNAQFITTAADEAYFEDLIVRIRALSERYQRAVDRYIPSIRESGAWAKAYSIYEAFLTLENEPPDAAAIAPAVARAAMDAAWNAYVRDREFLIELIRRDVINNQICVYLGLGGDDLGPPTTDDPKAVAMNGGKRFDWRQVADRINNALGEWHSMSTAEKAAIPQVLAARRIEAANRELAKRMDALETNQPATENAA